MADPRDELTELELMRLGIPRITVRPEGVAAPPPDDTGWGRPGADGRPAGRLFEPDRSPAMGSIAAPAGSYPALDPNVRNRYMTTVQEPGEPDRERFELPAARKARDAYATRYTLGGLVARDNYRPEPTRPWDPDRPRPDLAGDQRSRFGRAADYIAAPAKMIVAATTPPQPPERPVTGGLGPTERSTAEDIEFAKAQQKFAIDTGLGMMGAGRLPGASPPGAIGAGGGRRPASSPSVQTGVSAGSGVVPQVAERYPLILPPTQTFDPKTKNWFPQKTLSDEALQVQKARVAAQRDIDAGNYTPYFDPAKRADVNPANYPAMVSTKDVVRPAKESTRQKYEEMANTPEARARLEAAFQSGMRQQAGSENWYFMKQLEDEFIKEYGATKGSALFKERFADAMAATTGGADPTSNLMMAHYGNWLKARGEQVPPSHAFPFPIGGRYAGSNMDQFDKMIMQGQGISPTVNPKRYNFSGNFTGYGQGATIDEQMMGLIGATDAKGKILQMPPAGSYGHFEDVVHQGAGRAGVTPRYYQEVGWAGAKSDKTKGGFAAKPMIQIVNEAIERTHRITGMPRDEIVRRGLVRAEIPLYSGANDPRSVALGVGSSATRDPRMGSILNPIRAYHSSPHDFERFDISKIGTGEGAQVYGHGLYFAENPAVSGQGGQYWQQFKDRFAYNPAEMEAVNVLQNHNFNSAKAIEELEDSKKYDAGYIGGATNAHDRANRERIVKKNHEALELLKSGKPIGPRTYEVDINARPEQMLDWDKPMRGQSKQVEEVAKQFNLPLEKQYSAPGVEPFPILPAGKSLYEGIVRTRPGDWNPKAFASETLREAGIPGIRYLDQGSRPAANLRAQFLKDLEVYERSGNKTAVESIKQQLANPPQGTSNYVVFDPGIIDIMKKYGIVGGAPIGMGALAAQDRYDPRHQQ